MSWVLHLTPRTGTRQPGNMPSKKTKPMNTNFIKTCFLECLGKATLKRQNLLNCFSNQGLRLRSWVMRHASLMRSAISSRSSRALGQNARVLKIWVAEHIYTECSKFCKKKWRCMMPMITMACMNVHGKWMQMVRSLIRVEFGECISIQCSSQH